jgi:hypothetical protein
MIESDNLLYCSNFFNDIFSFLPKLFNTNSVLIVTAAVTAVATVVIAFYTAKLTKANEINKQLLAIEKEYREFEKLIKIFELFLKGYEATITKEIEEKIIEYANNNYKIKHIKYKNIDTLIAIFGEIINGTPKNSSLIMSMFDNKTFSIMTYLFLQENKIIKNKELIIKKLNLNEKKNIISKEDKYKTLDTALLTKLNKNNLHNLYHFIYKKIMEQSNAD